MGGLYLKWFLNWGGSASVAALPQLLAYCVSAKGEQASALVEVQSKFHHRYEQPLPHRTTFMVPSLSESQLTNSCTKSGSTRQSQTIPNHSRSTVTIDDTTSLNNVQIVPDDATPSFWTVANKVPPNGCYTDGHNDGMTYTASPTSDTSPAPSVTHEIIDLRSPSVSPASTTPASGDNSDSDEEPVHLIESETDYSTVDSDTESDQSESDPGHESENDLPAYPNIPVQTDISSNSMISNPASAFPRMWSYLHNDRFSTFVMSVAYDAVLTHQFSIFHPVDGEILTRTAYARLIHILGNTNTLERLYLSGPSNQRVQRIFRALVPPAQTPGEPIHTWYHNRQRRIASTAIRDVLALVLYNAPHADHTHDPALEPHDEYISPWRVIRTLSPPPHPIEIFPVRSIPGRPSTSDNDRELSRYSVRPFHGVYLDGLPARRRLVNSDPYLRRRPRPVHIDLTDDHVVLDSDEERADTNRHAYHISIPDSVYATLDDTDPPHTGIFNQSWVVDTGCSNHICNDYLSFETLNSFSDTLTGAGGLVHAIGIGTLNLPLTTDLGKTILLRLHDVLYCPDLPVNLLSIQEALGPDESTKVTHTQMLITLDDATITLPKAKNKLFYVRTRPESHFKLCLNAQQKSLKPADLSKIRLWHRKAGHPGDAVMRKFFQTYENRVKFGVSLKAIQQFFCDACMLSKSCKLPHTKTLVTRGAQRAGEAFSTDVAGPFKFATYLGEFYFVIFIDEYTRYTFVYLMRTRDELYDKFEEFLADVRAVHDQSVERVSHLETDCDDDLVRLHSDNASEYHKLQKILLKKYGVKMTFSQSYSPSQNGIAERKIRFILQMSRCFILEGNLQVTLWGYAVKAAVHHINVLPSIALDWENAHYKWHNKEYDIKKLTVFGCVAFAHIPVQVRQQHGHHKFQARAIKCMFVGYPTDRAGFILISVSDRQIITSRDVKFKENTFAVLDNSMLTDAQAAKECGCKDCIDSLDIAVDKSQTNIPSTPSPSPNDLEHVTPSPMPAGPLISVPLEQVPTPVVTQPCQEVAIQAGGLNPDRVSPLGLQPHPSQGLIRIEEQWSQHTSQTSSVPSRETGGSNEPTETRGYSSEIGLRERRGDNVTITVASFDTNDSPAAACWRQHTPGNSLIEASATDTDALRTLVSQTSMAGVSDPRVPQLSSDGLLAPETATPIDCTPILSNPTPSPDSSSPPVLDVSLTNPCSNTASVTVNKGKIRKGYAIPTSNPPSKTRKPSKRCRERVLSPIEQALADYLDAKAAQSASAANPNLPVEHTEMAKIPDTNLVDNIDSMLQSALSQETIDPQIEHVLNKEQNQNLLAYFLSIEDHDSIQQGRYLKTDTPTPRDAVLSRHQGERKMALLLQEAVDSDPCLGFRTKKARRLKRVYSRSKDFVPIRVDFEDDLHIDDKIYKGGVFHALQDKLDPAPTSYKAAMASPEADDWSAAMDSEYQSIIGHGTWILVPPPPKRKILNTRWVYVYKLKGDGTVERHKARIVVQGFLQRHGIDYVETFSPVVRMEVLRTLLTLGAVLDWEIHQMDVKTAFLNGELEEEIFIRQPEGYRVKGKEHMVCKLIKSLYGLKQAPRVWHTALTDYLISCGFRPLTVDRCVYVKNDNGKICIVSAYVDDLLIIGNTTSVMNHFKKQLHAKFKMTDLGEVNYMLGWHIKRDRSRKLIFINQEQYAEKVLKTYGFENARPVKTPMETNTTCQFSDRPTTDEDVAAMSHVPYRQVVGSLMYLMVGTRPDLATVIRETSQHLTNPGKKHWDVLKRTLCYLRGTTTHGIRLGGEHGLSMLQKGNMLSASVDASYAQSENRRSVTGYVTFLFGNSPISWRSQKQTLVTLSSTESEYVALSSTVQEILYLRSLTSDLGFPQVGPVPVQEDNTSCMKITKNPSCHGHTKHIDIKYHFNQQAYARKIIDLVQCPTSDMIADTFTKALPSPAFIKHRSAIGIYAYADIFPF